VSHQEKMKLRNDRARESQRGITNKN